jgi:hypothetical protein
MKSASSVCLATLVGGVLAGGTACFGGHGHASTHPAAAHHEAPKKSGAKPAHHPAPKPSEHAPHKEAGGKPGAAKQLSHEEHKPNSLLAGPKTHDKSHEQHHDDHHHDHHHGHGDHEWVGGVDVENGSVGASVDGAAGVVVPAGDGAGAAAVVPNVGGIGPSGLRQIQFSVAPSERDSYDTAAQAAGMSRSEWIRTRLNAAAGRELK